MTNALFQDQFLTNYTKSCFTTLASNTASTDRVITLTNSPITSTQTQDSMSSGQRWFVSSSAAPSYEADNNTAALLSYATVGVKGLPLPNTGGALDCYTSPSGWDLLGSPEISNKSLSVWVPDATLERSTQPNYLQEDGDILEMDRSTLEGNDVDDLTWTETQSSIKSVDSSDFRILEGVKQKDISPPVTPVSEVQTALKTVSPALQDNDRDGVKEPSIFHFKMTTCED